MFSENEYRRKMCEELQIYSKSVQRFTPKAYIAENVLATMSKIPRHEFAPNLPIVAAYANKAQPIGFGQTISQPYIVGVMTSLISPKPNDKILEIGTGSGYQAAVLASMQAKVYTIELIKELAQEAVLKFAKLDFKNITVTNNNGQYGWAQFAPFDAIIVTAALKSIPPALIQQLKINGKLVLPLENQMGSQELVLISKNDDSTIRQENILPVRFVPFQTDKLQ